MAEAKPKKPKHPQDNFGDKRPKKQHKYGPEAVTEALMKADGIKLYAAKLLGVNRHTMANYIKLYKLENVVEEASESLIDEAEGIMMENLRAKDMTTVRWFLQTRGKNRGYTMRNEMTGLDEEPIQITKIERTIVDPKGDK